MDPEVSLMLCCGPSEAMEEHQVHVEIADGFNRQSFPEIEEQIEAVWMERVAREPWLFNGAKFRLHSALLSTTPEEEITQNKVCSQSDKSDSLQSGDGVRNNQSSMVKFELGLTCYKDYLGTNWSHEAGHLRCHGEDACGDGQAFLSQPLGVGAVMATADGDLVLLRRSQRVAEAAGLLDIPGGHPEPKMVCPGIREEDIDVKLLQGQERAVVSEIFSSVCAEISDEVNVPVSSLSKPLFLGIALNHTSAGRPSAEFYVRCSLNTEEVRDLYKRGGPEAHESTDILFLSREKLLQLDKSALLWSDMCPSAKGAVLLYQRVMPDQ